jgi:hypothetical protein
MPIRAFTIAVLCAGLLATTAWADPPPGSGSNGKGPGGQGPPGHANDAPAPPSPPATPLSPEGQVTFGADQNVARDAVDTGKALPLADIVARITVSLGGRVIDARLMSGGRTLIYRLVVLSDDGVSRRIYVDAQTGDAVPAR